MAQPLFIQGSPEKDTSSMMLEVTTSMKKITGREEKLNCQVLLRFIEGATIPLSHDESC